MWFGGVMGNNPANIDRTVQQCPRFNRCSAPICPLDTDQELKQIVADLKVAGVYDNTLIFFLTDHGISHLRGKQFLYDEGIKVPLIVKFPNNEMKGTIRQDMVMQIDLLASSLAYAGLPIPKNVQGKDIFSNCR